MNPLLPTDKNEKLNKDIKFKYYKILRRWYKLYPKYVLNNTKNGFEFGELTNAIEVNRNSVIVYRYLKKYYPDILTKIHINVIDNVYSEKDNQIKISLNISDNINVRNISYLYKDNRTFELDETLSFDTHENKRECLKNIIELIKVGYYE